MHLINEHANDGKQLSDVINDGNFIPLQTLGVSGVHLKLEGLNPAGSIQMKAAVSMINLVPGEAIMPIPKNNQRANIGVVKAAYLAHHQGQTVNRDSYFLRFPDNERNRIIALPALIDAEFGVSGIEWIASFPANIERGIARASALLD